MLLLSSFFLNLVSTGVTEKVSAGGLQESLLLGLSVGNFLGKFLRRSSKGGSLARILGCFPNSYAVFGKVELYLFSGLAVIKTNLHSACADACALHVILYDRCSNDVLDSSHFLNVLSVHI